MADFHISGTPPNKKKKTTTVDFTLEPKKTSSTAVKKGDFYISSANEKHDASCNSTVQYTPLNLAPIKTCSCGGGSSDSQSLTLDGYTLGITNGNTVTLPNEWQTISLVGTELTIGPNGNTIDLSPILSGNTDLSFSSAVSPVSLNSSTGTDVTFTEGTGIQLTATGTNLTIINTDPDQVVSITGGTDISVSGTYPNFTIDNTATDLNGIYTGSGTVNYGTLATVTPDPFGAGGDFAIGTFPTWPNIVLNSTEKGFYIAENFYGEAGMIYDGNGFYVSSSAAAIRAETFAIVINNLGIRFNSGPFLQTGSGSPEGVILASHGSIYLNNSGGVNSLYTKQSGGFSNTGWVSLGTIGTTNLSFSGVSSPVTLNSSTGTDVTFTAGTGISLTGTATDLTIVNANPDQTVVLNNGTGINVTGTYPNFTINSTITPGYTRIISNISSNTAAGSASATDYYYLCSNTMTLTLPTAVGNTNRYAIKNVGLGAITVATSLSETIDGATTAVINFTNNSIDIISDGANWNII